ncbi:kinetochore-associated protein 1-like [Acipenser ruthenus]|uniref:kinetochore-associated protein 1-like n=1 Tax=Acipenser ruthenus TaxID=7906 RepID=UPI002741E0F0|nr:kinetochore-associated protein 1-like [Acipenser ruthenus]XP_058889017.1 kinetochore-associated protein 1-like [Acipenser ruthenus]XP_058889018.1 kinetochore-associated protein 1-like [Acipenser ruthenus]XP_058889019.1 kinetochore-associated protein 1-like [Acipenser ruthenus]
MWNDIELSTNDDTVTGRLCIDSRHECGTALYQVDTLVKVSSSDKVLSNPNLYASSSSNGCVVVADKSVILLDQNCQSVLLQLQFETQVDGVGLCQEGRFLVVAERNGNLHLHHVPSKKTVLTNALVQKPYNENQKTYRNLIIQEDDPGTYHMFVLTSDGFFHISNLQLAKIQQAIEKMDFGALKELQMPIKTAFFSTDESHTLGCHHAEMGDLKNNIQLIIGGSGDCVLSKWNMDPVQKTISIQNLVDSSLLTGVRKCQILDNLIFVLDDENILSMWDAYTLILVWYWPSVCIQDFLLTTEGESASVAMQGSANLKLIALTTQDNKQENTIRNLMVYSLPTMNLLYSLEVSDVSALVQTGVSMDTIYLLEGIYENQQRSLDATVSALVLRCLTEALPENRLSRLLYKHKFEEAERFAIQFGLDVELVYKVKLNFVLERLASASIGGYGQTVWVELVNEAKENLHKIPDDQFIVQYCIKAPWPTFETAQEMLNYAKSRILKKDDRKNAAFLEDLPILLTEILGALAKLSTFYGAFGPEKFSGISWIEFLNNKDVLSDIFWHLEERNLKCAQYLWLRHQPEFESQFDVEALEKLLNIIPADIPSRELCLWFKSVIIPFVRRIVPKGQKVLARWLEHRVRSLELTEKLNWPENGLEMAELYFVSRNPNELGLSSSWLWIPLKEDGDCEEVHQLKTLVGSLQQLLDLYKKYKCILPLSEFEKENKTTIAFRMLDKVLAPELIPPTLEKVIKPYIQEHNLQLEELLLQYIKDLLERCSSQSASLFETEWEAKAMAVLGCMSDTDLVFDAVLQIMYGAVVPWSEAVEQLVKQHLEMDHPKVKLLQESYRLMEMKKLLRGYGIRSFNLSDDKQIMKLVKYILKQDLPSSLEDALKVAQAYMLPTVEVCILRIVYLIGQDKVDECLKLLKTLPSDEAESTAERLAIWARLELHDQRDTSEEHKKHQMAVARTMVEILKFLQDIQKDSTLKRMQCENNLNMFEAIANLQEDFDIFLSLEDYENRTLLSQLREKHIETYENTLSRSKTEKTSVVAKGQDGKTKTISTESGLYRLALLLQLTEQELGAELAMRALAVGKVEKALKIFSELYQHHCNTQTGQVLLNAAQKLCQMLETNTPMIIPDGMNLPAVIHELACQAATICSTDLLLDCQELCKNTVVAMDVYRQCQIDDYGFIAKTSSLGADRDPYDEWTFEDFFNEDGIVLDPVMVLPVLYEITTNVVPYTAGKKHYPLDCSCLTNCPYVEEVNFLKPMRSPMNSMLQNLQECSQLELVLRLVVNSFGTCLQHVISNNMDMALSAKLYDRRNLVEDRDFIVAMGEKTVSVIKDVSLALLHKVFNCRVIDCDLALGYCTLLPKKDVFEKLWHVINNTWQNYNKVLAVAVVGAHLSDLYKDEEHRQTFQSLIADAEWGIHLGKLGISFQSVFRQCPARKKDLISTLVKNPNVNSELILKYCRTFDLDSDSALHLYIETLLLHGTNILHNEDDPMLEKNTKLSHSEYVAKALEIIPLLNRTSNLVISLSATIHKLSPYDYETIHGVLKVIQTADEKTTSIQIEQAIGLLQHLNSYRRISPPVDLEHHYILEKSLEVSAYAQSRLPFHLIFFQTTQCFWKIISVELCEESFPTLLLISKLMKVCIDKLYMSAVNHVFEKSLKPNSLKQSKEGHTFLMTKETVKTVQTIKGYLLSITNPEWAAATSHRIAQALPTGPDKTSALKFCLHLAERWLKATGAEDKTHAKAEVFLEKLKVQYQRSATENILIAFNLSTPEYLKLTGFPAKLIVSLYEHNSIEQRIQNPTGKDYPDIHAAAKEIAEINNIDISKIRDVLLEKWLCRNCQPSTDEDKTFEFLTDMQEDPELMRVIYLLQPYTMEHSARMLYTIATAETSPISTSGARLTFAHRSRALLCLIQVAEEETVVSLIKMPIEKVKYYLKCCIYLAEFELLNIPYTVESFHNSPKEGMIKGLWKNHSHEPRAVRLVTELSLEYQVYDPQLWNGVLQKLLSFSMISYMRKVLVAITAVHSLWQIPNFIRAWRNVILAPFLSASYPPSPKQLETCYETFVLLLKCPVLADLDMIGIAKQFAQLDLPAFTLGSLLLIPQSEKKEQQIQGFLSTSNLVTVLQQVETHMSTGEVAGFSAQIKELVLDFINSNKLYEKLIKTKLLPLLRQHVIKSNQVKGLVDYLVNKSCLDDAASLVSEYLRHKGKPLPANISTPDILKEFAGDEKRLLDCLT